MFTFIGPITESHLTWSLDTATAPYDIFADLERPHPVRRAKLITRLLMLFFVIIEIASLATVWKTW
jgi:hypothetical protein